MKTFLEILVGLLALPLVLLVFVLVWLHLFDTLDADEDETWESLDPRSVTQDTVAAVFLSNYAKDEGNDTRGATVAFIDGRGRMTTVASGKLDNGPVSMNADGDVAWESPRSSYAVSGSEKREVRRPETLEASSQTLLDTPSELYVADRRSGLPLRWLVRQAPGENARRVATWRVAGFDDGLRLTSTSGLVLDRGRAWFLEDLELTPSARKGATNGVQSVLRLASVDLRSGRYRSTTLRSWGGTDRSRPAKGSGYPGPDAWDAYAHDGAIWFVDAHGSICRASLTTRRLTCADQRLPKPWDHDQDADAYHSWAGDEIAVLTTGQDTNLARYDLATGRRTSRVALPELAAFLDEHPSRLLMDFAARPAPSDDEG